MPRTIHDFASPSTVECAYCSRDVPAAGLVDNPPAVDDDAAWSDLARHHLPGCEWILTHAHRRDVEQLTLADTDEIERQALAAADDDEDERPSYLILGCGGSSIPAVRDADNDDENWTLARVLMPEQVRTLVEQSKVPGERWCVLVAGVDPSDLDGDTSVIAYRTIYDFPAALGACLPGVERDVVLRAAAIEAMRAAGAIK